MATLRAGILPKVHHFEPFLRGRGRSGVFEWLNIKQIKAFF
ncbi:MULTISPECIES: hypothetical protein [Haemophilus]|nr:MULTISPECIES: hypothetical protein [Haemophilus]